ncbi:unnamed protein product [Rangifer tarandus platyrhynchus]|uniref:Uncharacterized protein n=1 Tax=Rangifer tarandus platyrhynchus TaxID=3082113 RepID=A0AC59Z127_RANTA
MLCILPPELRPTCRRPGDNTQAYGPHPCTASQKHPHLSHVRNEQHLVSCPGPLKRVVWLGARNALHASYAGLLPGSRVDAEGERPPGLGKLSPAPATDAERAGGGAYPRPRFPEGSARTGSLGSRLQTSRRCLPRRRDANARLVLGAVRPSAGPFLLRLRPPVSFSPPPPPPGRTL